MRDHILSIWPAGGLESILDLGCRDAWHTAGLPGVRRHVGVDIWPEALARGTAKAQAGGIPGWEPVLGDAIDYLVKSTPNSFDAVLAIDLMEHLDQGLGAPLLAEMRVTARWLAVVWTTLGMIPQAGYDVDGNPNPYEVHKWGPDPGIFEALGYNVRIIPDQHGPRGGAIFAWYEKRD